MTGPNLLGRRADLEVTELRIDSQQSVPERVDFLKDKYDGDMKIKALFAFVYRHWVNLQRKEKRRFSERLFCSSTRKSSPRWSPSQIRIGMMM
jgi:hypothetical protein